MQPTIPDDVAESQRVVQRLLGRCLIRLQQYERLLKTMVAHQELSGPTHALEKLQAARIAEAADKSLGILVGRFVGSYLVRAGVGPPEVEQELDEDPWSFSFRTRLSLTSEDYDRMQADLRELVAIRNGLVHHFIEQHDLWTADGCRTATEKLDGTYARIDRSLEELKSIAEHMINARSQMAELMQTPEFHDAIVNGINPDGSVHWPMAGSVSALREASRELAVDGWTPMDTAARWIATHRPEQTPQKYGCSRWRHLLHVSGEFELRRMTHHGRNGLWYRDRQTLPDIQPHALLPNAP